MNDADRLRETRARQPRVSAKDANRQIEAGITLALARRLHLKHCKMHGVEPWPWWRVNQDIWIRKAKRVREAEKKTTNPAGRD